MKNNLFKNFKTLKERELEKNRSQTEKVDNVSDLTNQQMLKTEIELKESTGETLDIVKNSAQADSKISKTKEVVKKRPLKKKIFEAREKLTQSGSNIEYAKKLNINDSKRTFTIFLKSSSLEFLKDLVFYKATTERQIFYNQSEAISEALSLILSDFKNIIPRPDSIKIQEKNKKGGRKRNSDEVYDASTTVYISAQSYDFVKDVTYNKVIGGDLYYKDWDLLEASIEKLREKYGDNIQPRPDYIREDEKLRGRKKTNI